MEVESAEELLNYVFTENDFSLKPSQAEYKKLTRIMVIMTQFYERGSDSKKAALDKEVEYLGIMDMDLKMLTELLESVRQFSPDYPKRLEYERNLVESIEMLERARKRTLEDEKKWRDLYEWSCKIVETIHWLNGWLKEYSSTKLKTDFENIPEQPPLPVDLYRIYKRGLEEITYNLQESQDFFDASLDGRLTKYHRVNEEMVQAQLNILKQYSGESKCRQALEEDLLKDLEYIKGHMEMSPRVVKIRENMRKMHQDFFALLKWQREKMLCLPFEARHKLTGDVESLRRELRQKSGETLAEAMNYHLVPDDEHTDTRDQKEIFDGAMGCPLKVMGDESAKSARATGEESNAGCLSDEVTIDKLKIHRLCE